jgi:hypothetical protein
MNQDATIVTLRDSQTWSRILVRGAAGLIGIDMTLLVGQSPQHVIQSVIG